MSKFLNSLADKANAHLHNLPTLDQLPHSARTARVSLDPRRSEYTKPLQMVLTSQKGVVIDYESVARESKVTSKELFIWGKEQQEDLKDVTDRLAYLTFLCGDLASAHSKSLETARGSLKELRDAENNLGRERAARDKIRNQMTQLREGKHKDKPESNSKVEEFRKELERLEGEDEGEELEVEKLKRAKLAECFEKQFDSIQEYAEKLLLVAAHGRAFLTSLDSSLAHAPYRRPSKGYSGADNTGSVRSSLESSIKNWTPKPLNIPTTSSPGHPGREGSIASFGDTHGHELNRIPSVDQSNASGGNTPSTTSGQNGGQATHHTSPGNNSVRFDDSKAPQLPPRDPFADPHASNGGKNTAPVPTVAETGVPSTGTGGPASGQIGHPEADEDSVIGDGSEWGSNLDRAPTYKSTYDGPSGDKYPVEETADKGKAPAEAPKKTKEEEAAEDAARAAHEGGDKPAPQYQ